MKLHYHPAATTCRPIMLFAADHGIDLDLRLVDLFQGENLQPAYAAVNPNEAVPVLEDGDFRLTESTAILKYLADGVGSAAYPGDRRRRALIDSRLDWFNTGLMRDFCYGFVYPQVLPHHRRPTDAEQQQCLAWHRGRARRWLGILDEHYIGPSNAFVCGSAPTLADYFGSALVTLGDVARVDFGHWRNVSRWLQTMKARPNWAAANAVFNQHFVAPYAGATFEAL